MLKLFARISWISPTSKGPRKMVQILNANTSWRNKGTRSRQEVFDISRVNSIFCHEASLIGSFSTVNHLNKFKLIFATEFIFINIHIYYLLFIVLDFCWNGQVYLLECYYLHKKYNEERLILLHIEEVSCSLIDNTVLYMLTKPWSVLFLCRSLK